MGVGNTGDNVSNLIDDTRDRLSSLSGQELFALLLLLGIAILLIDLVRRLTMGELALGRLWRYTWNGLVDSLYIALAAIGLSMTYSILRFANFSHGDLVTTGAFSGWAVAWVIGGWGMYGIGELVLFSPTPAGPTGGELGMDVLASPVAILVGLVAAALLTIGVALAIDRLVYKRMRDTGGIPLLIASVGVALALRYIIGVFWTVESHSATASAPIIEDFPDWMWWVPFDRVNLHELTLVLIAVGLIIGLHLLLQYTKLGKAMRAMADNKDLALITGIPTERVIFATWTIGAGLAGVAGYLIVLDRGQFSINIGWFLLLLIFAAVILGGIGSIYGALVGSLVIGLTINVSLVWIPADMNEIAAFTLMILILIIKPDGLLGGVETA
ncbi:branched-chain amino acid ABC transporter permease [Natronorubrum sp. JWXQ-INN-674]|uniref:Branched-chain amino acid ABC transporter permease n=1 Tax=Natronorubrum halalkaliphilum TaxID=2691917 RepID=A0A6B0VU74_9EURY|nr:branched-chain amino acid ABC transporter permease [Natronorubrum halalkaliphilum]MXV64302.1 branched-chain amino acid ABC transporter permease [Natronorubrum halalkaliphilum]